MLKELKNESVPKNWNSSDRFHSLEDYLVSEGNVVINYEIDNPISFLLGRFISELILMNRGKNFLLLKWYHFQFYHDSLWSIFLPILFSQVLMQVVLLKYKSQKWHAVVFLKREDVSLFVCLFFHIRLVKVFFSPLVYSFECSLKVVFLIYLVYFIFDDKQ